MTTTTTLWEDNAGNLLHALPQLIRIGNTYINTAHIVSARMGTECLEQGADVVCTPTATIALAVPSGLADEGAVPLMYQFYGETALALGAFLDGLAVVVSEVETPRPLPQWEPSAPPDGTRRGEDAPVHEHEDELYPDGIPF